MHQGRRSTDEEVRIGGDIEIEHGNHLAILDPGTLTVPFKVRIAVADHEITGHHPALPGLPEPVECAADDRLVAQLDLEGLARWVVMHDQNGMVVEGTGPCVLGQDLVADREVLDRPGARTECGPVSRPPKQLIRWTGDDADQKRLEGNLACGW